ncbi:aspartic proteinase PCS1-like [Olea europaea var. sylvestris]|uniref:aspartic proteinase PCS1-like n=1 Tax=Olea europaea var. sylvestris TaxID=158386 RepID=UPI000C1D514C|nr:aspartic proteinase PCS1-like [Olea europaea var. sylvestris]
MASSNSLFLICLVFFYFIHLSCTETETRNTTSESCSISLSYVPLSLNSSSASSQGDPHPSSLVSSPKGHGHRRSKGAAPSSPSIHYKSSFRYSVALIVSIPIGTPPQTVPMVLDTGSQLSWIQCQKKSPRKSPTTSFDPSLSSTFSNLPCNSRVCMPRNPDFTLPTSCENNLCHYSYFYADGTLADGNLVIDKLRLSPSQTTRPLVLGCTNSSGEAQGILGMNLGRLSFPSQAKIKKFSYCVPLRQGTPRVTPIGTFYLGKNPNSHTFKYVNLLSFPQIQSMPNFDPLAYTLPMTGIMIAGKKLRIPVSVFRPDAGGSGQTMIDSGTQYTFLVDEAYSKVKEKVVSVAGRRLKPGYVHGGSLDMCFDGNSIDIGRLIGDMVFQFENGVDILINKERVLDDVGGGVHCVGIGRSSLLGTSSNIIGNFHQQSRWVEFDLVGRKVGFGAANCSKPP